MSSFTAPLTVTDMGHGKWRLDRAFRYYIGVEGSENYVDVPEGYMTDFFSIPWFGRWLIPKATHGNQAAVLHDFMYQTHTFNRLKCDKIFLEAMEVLGVKLLKRRLIYRAVRIGGWAHY